MNFFEIHTFVYREARQSAEDLAQEEERLALLIQRQEERKDNQAEATRKVQEEIVSCYSILYCQMWPYVFCPLYM